MCARERERERERGREREGEREKEINLTLKAPLSRSLTRAARSRRGSRAVISRAGTLNTRLGAINTGGGAATADHGEEPRKNTRRSVIPLGFSSQLMWVFLGKNSHQKKEKEKEKKREMTHKESRSFSPGGQFPFNLRQSI